MCEREAWYETDNEKIKNSQRGDGLERGGQKQGYLRKGSDSRKSQNSGLGGECPLELDSRLILLAQVRTSGRRKQNDST